MSLGGLNVSRACGRTDSQRVRNACIRRKAQAKDAGFSALRGLFALAKEHGFEFGEDPLYPPNEPQFTADQLSARLAKALLRG